MSEVTYTAEQVEAVLRRAIRRVEDERGEPPDQLKMSMVGLRHEERLRRQREYAVRADRFDMDLLVLREVLAFMREHGNG